MLLIFLFRKVKNQCQKNIRTSSLQHEKINAKVENYNDIAVNFKKFLQIIHYLQKKKSLNLSLLILMLARGIDVDG